MKRCAITMNVNKRYRIQSLDIARGLAVLGILLVNMRFYSTSLQAIQWQVELWPSWWDQVVTALLRLFVEGKFLAIFALLFGYGMVMSYQRAIEAGVRFVPMYTRRLLILAVFGLIHGLLVWYGDILLHYALLGFLLLFFRKCAPKTLYTCALLLLASVPALLLLQGNPSADLNSNEEFQAWLEQAIALDTTIYGSGDYRVILQKRVEDWISSTLNQVMFYPQILGLFLLGAGLAKQRILHEVGTTGRSLLRIAAVSGVMGIGITLIPLVWHGTESNGVQEALRVLIGAPAMGLFYLIVLTIALRNKRWQRILRPLGDVGRLALTNYLGQSLLCTLIFYGYGLGWFGKVGPLVGTLIAVVIFGVQLAVSRMWLRRFHMGPLEWLWRTGTYLSAPPMRKADRSITT